MGMGEYFCETFVCNLGSSVTVIGSHIHTHGTANRKGNDIETSSFVEIITKIFFSWYVGYLEKLKNNKNIETFNSIRFISIYLGSSLQGIHVLGLSVVVRFLNSEVVSILNILLQGEWILLFPWALSSFTSALSRKSFFHSVC